MHKTCCVCIAALTNNYTAPENADEDYVEAMNLLKQFRQALDEHIAMENEVVFPMAMKLEGLSAGY